MSGPPDAVPGGHRARWAAIVVLVVAAGLIAVLATSPSATVASVDSPLVGEPAPPIAGPTIDGNDFSLPREPGRFIVLNFFASWCVPCQEEGPQFVKFEFEHHRSGDASMVSVLFNDTVDAVRRYQTTLGVTWPTLTDPGGQLALAYGVRGQPTTFVIAPDGRVVAYIVAPVTAGELNRVIARAKASHP